MASIIRVKRSTGTSAPSSLNFGEVGVTLSGSGTQEIVVIDYLLVIIQVIHR